MKHPVFTNCQDWASSSTKLGRWSHERHWCRITVNALSSGLWGTHEQWLWWLEPALRQLPCLGGSGCVVYREMASGGSVLFVSFTLNFMLETRASIEQVLFKVKFINWNLKSLGYENRSWSRSKPVIIWQGPKAFTTNSHYISQICRRWLLADTFVKCLVLEMSLGG